MESKGEDTNWQKERLYSEADLDWTLTVLSYA